MAVAGELLTPAEAAVVADVSVRNINRIFDEPILPKRFLQLKGGRRLQAEACAYVRFYFHTAPRLTSDERSRVIRTLAAEKSRSRIYRDDLLTVNLDRFVEETTVRHATLVRARRAVTEDPEVLGGTPVLRGTRIPVHDVAASVRSGQPKERLRAAYPSLDDETIELAIVYADANPARGRPRHAGDADRNLELVSEKKVARHPRR